MPEIYSYVVICFFKRKKKDMNTSTPESLKSVKSLSAITILYGVFQKKLVGVLGVPYDELVILRRMGYQGQSEEAGES